MPFFQRLLPKAAGTSAAIPVTIAALAGLGDPRPASAQERLPSHCIALAQSIPGAAYVHKAAWQDPVPADSVRISYIGHSSFLIQTTGGLSAITDFTGATGGAAMVPDVVTMNNSHSSHFTYAPDPRIPHPLEGWADEGGPRLHEVDLGEMLVRNVPTDARPGFGGMGMREAGNSIFIFEAAGLCIGHLGHLHHEPDAEQYAQIGRLDVVMVPVDGGMTLDTDSMIRVMERFRARVVLPMHWFGRSNLDRFLERMGGDFQVIEAGMRDIVLSQQNLPTAPTVMVLEPGLLD